MQKLLKFIKIGFEIFLVAFHDCSYMLTNDKYPEIKEKKLSLYKTAFGIFLISCAFYLLSGERIKNIVEQWFFIIIGVTFAVVLFYDGYIFFAIWRKLYKERMEKENKK